MAILEKLMKECPGGSYNIMKSTPRVHGDRSLMAIGYNYIYHKVIRFISKEGGQK